MRARFIREGEVGTVDRSVQLLIKQDASMTSNVTDPESVGWAEPQSAHRWTSS